MNIPTLITLIAVVVAITVRAEEEIPEGYVMQVLEPTGGKILKPEAWFYVEGHRENAFMWTLSKEDTGDGDQPYETGVRIQTFVGIEAKTGTTPEAFVKKFLATKQGGVETIHRVTKEADLGLFTRVCLEVDEGEFRILYSLFWGNKVDVVVMSIAGAKQEEWNQYADTFDRMSAFELIDMERFEDDADEEEKTSKE